MFISNVVNACWQTGKWYLYFPLCLPVWCFHLVLAQRIGETLLVPFGAITGRFDYPGYQRFRVETGTHPSVLWHEVVSCRVMCHFLPEEWAGQFLKFLLFLIKYFPACQCWYQWKYLGHLLNLHNHIWIILAVVRLGSTVFEAQLCSEGMQVSAWIQLVLNLYSNHINRNDIGFSIRLLSEK